MKILRDIAFGLAVIIGLSVSVSAQKNDQKRPPKDKPPVVTPKDKPPKGDKPKDDKGRGGGKKPGLALASPQRPEEYV